MFDPTATYHKSALGTEAMAQRHAVLTPKLRSMLILIDGKRRYEELVRLAAVLGDPPQLMAQLADHGFIEPLPGTAAPPAGTAPPQAKPAVTLQEAQRQAVRRLTDLLGPHADDLCMRIEATRSVPEFQAALKRAENLLRQVGSAERAARFSAEMEAYRPG